MWSTLYRFILGLFGWKVITQGELPKQYIIAVVPHTSNWDFPIGILTRTIMHQDIKFVAKESLFRPPFGGIFRWLGGYPVDRSKSNRYVDNVVDIFRKEDEFKLCIAPEGTRSKVEKLKTGFYYIAKGAGVPILLCKFDYATREVVVSEPFWPTEDAEADFAFINDFFRGTRGKNPELSFLYEEEKETAH